MRDWEDRIIHTEELPNGGRRHTVDVSGTEYDLDPAYYEEQKRRGKKEENTERRGILDMLRDRTRRPAQNY